MRKYQVAYATGSRADYGIVKNYLQLLNKDEIIDFSVLVTGSHLENKFGYTVDIIKSDGFNIGCEIPLDIDNSSNANVLHSMSIALDSFGYFFENNRLDLLIVLGDRYEMMGVTIAAAMQRIPILHLHGGETTYGNYDEFIRHCITKMSLYHFTSTEIYRQRVIQLGEDPERVFYMGALGAENCRNIDISRVVETVFEMSTRKYWVIAFHPETLTNVNMVDQVQEVIAALDELKDGSQYVFIGTNADTKSDVIRNAWMEYVSSHGNACYFENLNVDSFLWLVKNSLALIGNSSSGIIETPSLGKFTVNIGARQRGRVRGDSVIDIPCNKKSIVNAMKEVSFRLQQEFTAENPYYFENTASRYYQKTKELLQKEETSLKEFYNTKWE